MHKMSEIVYGTGMLIVERAREVLDNPERNYSESDIKDAKRIMEEYRLNPGYFEKNGMQTQPANLGDKMAFPTYEEMMLIEKLRLEVVNKDPVLRVLTKYFIKEDENGRD